MQVEFHKRWDPIYADARARMRSMGDPAYFSSFMSQPKFQLEVRLGRSEGKGGDREREGERVSKCVCERERMRERER